MGRGTHQIRCCFRKKYSLRRWGWGVLLYPWVCCENDTIFFLKCFIGGQKLPFLYISPKYLRCKKILALRQSRNANFRFRCHFYTELQNATTNGHGLLYWFFLSSDDQWPSCRSSIIGWLSYKVGLPPIMRANNDMTLCRNLESR